MPLPDRPVLQEAAAKADLLTKWGKPVSEFDRIELKAWVWELLTRRIDNLTERLTPTLDELERSVRQIESLGYRVNIVRVDDPTGASFTAVLGEPTILDDEAP